MLGLRMLACSTGAVIYLTDANSVNLYSAYVDQYGVPAAAVAIYFIIPAGVMIGSTSATIPALLNPANWPVGSVINLVNQGLIAGMGGAGGVGGYDDADYFSVIQPTAGRPGGTALKAQYPLIIDNSAGIIRGGGGGGGGGAAFVYPGYSHFSFGGSGGGGAGAQPGLAGLKYGDSEAQRGAVGSLAAGGAGGLPRTTAPIPAWGTAGSGGAGGAPGTAGAAGQSADYITGAAGGAAGKAIEGSGHITWVSTGTTLGPIA